MTEAISVDVLIPSAETEGGRAIVVSYGGDRISKNLYLHGLTHRKIEIRLVPDKFVDEEFNLYR